MPAFQATCKNSDNPFSSALIHSIVTIARWAAALNLAALTKSVLKMNCSKIALMLWHHKARCEQLLQVHYSVMRSDAVLHMFKICPPLTHFPLSLCFFPYLQRKEVCCLLKFAMPGTTDKYARSFSCIFCNTGWLPGRHKFQYFPVAYQRMCLGGGRMQKVHLAIAARNVHPTKGNLQQRDAKSTHVLIAFKRNRKPSLDPKNHEWKASNG